MAAHNRGSVNVFVQEENGSLEAIAMAERSSAFGENLKQQLGAAPVQLQIA
jgi:hypothetical protein